MNETRGRPQQAGRAGQGRSGLEVIVGYLLLGIVLLPEAARHDIILSISVVPTMVISFVFFGVTSSSIHEVSKYSVVVEVLNHQVKVPALLLLSRNCAS